MKNYITAEFGKGKYFIGDICYALPDKIYNEIWGNKFHYEDGFYKEYGFAVAGTAYGDGLYNGTDGNIYPVDAGNIGITDLKNGQQYGDEKLNALGSVVNVNESISMERLDNGKFIFIVDGEQFSISTDFEK